MLAAWLDSPPRPPPLSPSRALLASAGCDDDPYDGVGSDPCAPGNQRSSGSALRRAGGEHRRRWRPGGPGRAFAVVPLAPACLVDSCAGAIADARAGRAHDRSAGTPGAGVPRAPGRRRGAATSGNTDYVVELSETPEYPANARDQLILSALHEPRYLRNGFEIKPPLGLAPPYTVQLTPDGLEGTFALGILPFPFGARLAGLRGRAGSRDPRLPRPGRAHAARARLLESTTRAARRRLPWRSVPEAAVTRLAALALGALPSPRAPTISAGDRGPCLGGMVRQPGPACTLPPTLDLTIDGNLADWSNELVFDVLIPGSCSRAGDTGVTNAGRQIRDGALVFYSNALGFPGVEPQLPLRAWPSGAIDLEDGAPGNVHTLLLADFATGTVEEYVNGERVFGAPGEVFVGVTGIEWRIPATSLPTPARPTRSA
jgi:hypothetical protein